MPFYKMMTWKRGFSSFFSLFYELIFGPVSTLIFSDARRSNIHRKKHTFFRASEYIATDFKQYGVSKEKTESRIDIKEKFKDEEIYKDREAQIKAIEKTFEDALVRIF